MAERRSVSLLEASTAFRHFWVGQKRNAAAEPQRQRSTHLVQHPVFHHSTPPCAIDTVATDHYFKSKSNADLLVVQVHNIVWTRWIKGAQGEVPEVSMAASFNSFKGSSSIKFYEIFSREGSTVSF